MYLCLHVFAIIKYGKNITMCYQNDFEFECLLLLHIERKERRVIVNASAAVNKCSQLMLLLVIYEGSG